jgi:hypothetical protein
MNDTHSSAHHTCEGVQQVSARAAMVDTTPRGEHTLTLGVIGKSSSRYPDSDRF